MSFRDDAVASAIEEMVDYFMPHCADTSTLEQLKKMAATPKLRRKGHALFERIRDKTLGGDASDDSFLQHQYVFEEYCAKTLFNLSGSAHPAPFDDDSPFWVLPCAVEFARIIGVDDPCAVSSLLRPATDADQ